MRKEEKEGKGRLNADDVEGQKQIEKGGSTSPKSVRRGKGGCSTEMVGWGCRGAMILDGTVDEVGRGGVWL